MVSAVMRTRRGWWREESSWFGFIIRKDSSPFRCLRILPTRERQYDGDEASETTRHCNRELFTELFTKCRNHRECRRVRMDGKIFNAASGAASSTPDVAQISNLPNRRFPMGRPSDEAHRAGTLARSAGWKPCDTAD